MAAYPASGLGPGIVNALVTAHGGQLTVTSAGNVSRFTVQLPVGAPPRECDQ